MIDIQTSHSTGGIIAPSFLLGDMLCLPKYYDGYRNLSPEQPGSLAIIPAIEDDFETKDDFKQRLTDTIAQMMFVSGETAEPSAETTWMIEEIVREQVLEMVFFVQTKYLRPTNGLAAHSSHHPCKPSRVKVHFDR